MARMTKHWFPLAVYLTLVFCIAACAVPTASHQSPSATTLAGGEAVVSVDETATHALFPSDFIGLSYEASLLAEARSFPTKSGNLVALFGLLGQGNLRIGGNSVDRQMFWQPGNRAVPPWATAVVKPADIDRLAQFSTTTGWKVELAVNLGHLDTAAIASEAQYARAALSKQLVALSCGNEPNDFPKVLRPAGYGYVQYHADFTACANAIGTSVPIAGPDTTGAYISALVHDEASRLTLITQHAYTLNQCHGQHASVTQLLSAASDQSELSKVEPTLQVAQTIHLPLRLDETNSVSCGNSSGVGDVYASALWAVDYMLLMAQQGVAGVNFHGGLGICSQRNGLAGWYTPLCAASFADLQADLFTPQPLYYGMLFTSLLGPGRFYGVTVSTASNLTAYALGGNDGRTRVMLIEKDDPTGPPIMVRLRCGTSLGTAQVLHLTGSSLTGNQGISIQGARIDQSGHFRLPKADQLQGSRGLYTLALPAGSAALITLP
ncbi:MAG TPA: hypothetical protein VKR06_10550 [Ktedonosporobacter sp.]|nr:hypothetical protein [Ktedonosporobacter sp.]